VLKLKKKFRRQKVTKQVHVTSQHNVLLSDCFLFLNLNKHLTVSVAQEDGSARHYRYSQQFDWFVQRSYRQSNPGRSSSALQTGYISYRLSMSKDETLPAVEMATGMSPWWLRQILIRVYDKGKNPCNLRYLYVKSVTFPFQDPQTQAYRQMLPHSGPGTM